MRVRWEEIDRDTYEDMVSVLLSHLHPESQRIDGRGGDGGRDVQFGPPDELSIFQLKSFTGRMTPGRRAQVERSLQSAAGSNPGAWTLVMPIDPTPKELGWLEGLRSSVSFPLTFRGRTWLDKELSARPEICRYFVEKAADEVVTLLTQMKEEGAAVVDASGAAARARKLHDRLNEIDPHYRYDLTTGDAAAAPPPSHAVFSAVMDGVRVNVYGRYKGAVDDRPITVELKLEFTASDIELREEFVRSMDYGTPVFLPARVLKEVNLKAPGGLGGSFSGGDFELGPANSVNVEPHSIHAEIRNEEEVVASLPLTLQVGSRGQILCTLSLLRRSEPA